MIDKRFWKWFNLFFKGKELKGNSKTLHNKWEWSLVFLRFDDKYIIAHYSFLHTVWVFGVKWQLWLYPAAENCDWFSCMLQTNIYSIWKNPGEKQLSWEDCCPQGPWFCLLQVADFTCTNKKNPFISSLWDRISRSSAEMIARALLGFP